MFPFRLWLVEKRYFELQFLWKLSPSTQHMNIGSIRRLWAQTGINMVCPMQPSIWILIFSDIKCSSLTDGNCLVTFGIILASGGGRCKNSKYSRCHFLWSQFIGLDSWHQTTIQNKIFKTRICERCEMLGWVVFKIYEKVNLELALDGPMINILVGQCIVISFQQNC